MYVSKVPSSSFCDAVIAYNNLPIRKGRYLPNPCPGLQHLSTLKWTYLSAMIGLQFMKPNDLIITCAMHRHVGFKSCLGSPGQSSSSIPSRPQSPCRRAKPPATYPSKWGSDCPRVPYYPRVIEELRGR